VTELSSVIKDKDKEQKILNAKELLLVMITCSATISYMFTLHDLVESILLKEESSLHVHSSSNKLILVNVMHVMS